MRMFCFCWNIESLLLEKQRVSVFVWNRTIPSGRLLASARSPLAGRLGLLLVGKRQVDKLDKALCARAAC
jgi:hypothetical protein